VLERFYSVQDNARMAELVDALVSGTSIRTDVQVRVLFRAQLMKINPCFLNSYKGFSFFDN
jgi:hypothetical protein